jgi:multisubunit Na+/H+ antiporter MnhB subunit
MHNAPAAKPGCQARPQLTNPPHKSTLGQRKNLREFPMNKSILVLLGAIAGGVVGFFVTAFVAGQGMEAMAIPGGLAGFGAGVVKGRSILPAILCGLFALALGIFTEWHLFPFIADHSFPYFIKHLHHLSALTLIMIAVGGFIGFWVPFRRIQKGG